MGAAFFGAAAFYLATGGWAIVSAAKRIRPFLRPPGALPEKEFLQRCIRCAKCAQVCPTTAIRMKGFGSGLKHLNTP